MRRGFQTLFRSAWWVLLPLGLALANAWIVRGWFHGEWPRDLGVIDVAYVQASRFVAMFTGHSAWVPYWYGGFPLHTVYNPAFPYLAWLVHGITHLPWGQVERVLGGVGYALTPAALFLFVRSLTRRTGLAFVAGLAATVAPSAAYLLRDAYTNGGPADYASIYAFGPWRFAQLTQFGEATHSFAMFLVPLTGWGFIRLLRSPKLSTGILAAVLLAATALSSMIALLGTLVLMLALTVAELFAAKRKSGAVFTTIGATVATAVGLAAFWFNPQFLAASFSFGTGESVLSNYLRGVGLIPLTAAILFAGLYRIFHRRPNLTPVLVGLLWFAPLFAFAFAWYRYHLSFAPQAIRYIPEMDLALITLIVALLAALYRTIEQRRGGRIATTIVTSVIAVALGWSGLAFVRQAPSLTRPRTEPIEASYEYRVARRIAATAGSQRVFVSGNPTFYLNAFTETPQLRGSLDQAAVNPWWPHLSYQLATNEASIARGEARAVAEAIVRAEDIGYVLVESGASHDPFRDDWKHPEVYAAWAPMWSEQGDTLYRTPLRLPGPFQLADTGYERLAKPVNGADPRALAAYADWVDGRAKAVEAFRWVNAGSAEITATVSPGEVLSAQVTYARGWRVRSSAGGRPSVTKDVLGNVVVRGLPTGAQTVRLTYGRPPEVLLGYLVTLLTLLALVLYPRWIRPWLAVVRTRADAAATEERRRHREELKQLGLVDHMDEE